MVVMFKYILLTIMLTTCILGQSRFNQMQVKGSQDSTFSQDASTNAINIIDYAHHEIHSGRHYFVEGYKLLDSGDSLIFLFNVNDTTRWAHLLFRFTSTTSLAYSMYENAISGGSPLDTLTTRITPLNNNRNSANTSVHDIFYGTTINGFIDDSLGTVLASDSIGVAGGSPFDPNVGGESSRDDEIILKQNTSYLWIVVSKAADNIVRFKANWYEHINKN
jgi:hypothetical protein